MQEEWVIKRNQIRREVEVFYRDMALKFGLSGTASWILYTLAETEGELSQQTLGEKWNYPKQTVHSAIQKLRKDGYITLSVVPGTRNRKEIKLTDAGKQLAQNTVCRLRDAEKRAAGKLSEAERRQYLELSEKYLDFLKKETAHLDPN